MQIPFMNPVRKSIQFTDQFRGYLHNLKSNEDGTTFFDMQNMTMDNYPIIQTRKGRHNHAYVPTVQEGTNHVSLYPTGDQLVFANGTSLFYGTFEEGWTLVSNAIQNSRKQFATIGAYVLILPDALVFNTHTGGLTSIRKRFEAISMPLDISPCVLGDDGNYSTVTYVSSDTAPENHQAYWYDTVNKELKKYSGISYSWVGVGTAFLKVTAFTIDTSLKSFFANEVHAWDTITFTELTCADADQQAELDKIARNEGPEGMGDNVIYGSGEDYVVIAGFVTEPITVDSYVIERRMPEMDFITSLNNRIWGCNSEKHEVYACKLGDPLQWFNYPGIASDSYAATVGSFGDFTGATSLNSYALFFKENSYFKVYGDYPANFQIVETVCEGVEKGSERSIQELNGALYYKGINGLMMYDGSVPQPFSTGTFGWVKYSNAVAGAIQEKYFISMNDGTDASLFVYDSTKGMWTKEDDLDVRDFIAFGNKLYTIDSDEQIWSFPEDSQTDYDDEGTDTALDWSLTTCYLGLNNPNHKFISRIQLRFELEGSIDIYVSYNSGTFSKVFHRTTDQLRSYTVPIKVKRCDHYRLKIEGTGHIKLYSYGYSLESGSDVPC